MELPMRKIILTFVCVLCLTAFTTGVTFASEPGTIDETIGEIVYFNWDVIHVVGEAITPHGCDDIIAQIGDAPIYDLTTGFSAKDITIGTEAHIRYLRQPGFPPQALAVWLHPNHASAAVFTTEVSGNIQYGPDYCVFMSACGRNRVVLTAQTIIYDPIYGYLHPHDIEPGQEFFVWVDKITASSPALVYPDKVVLLCE